MDFNFVLHSTLLRIIHREKVSFWIGAIIFPAMIVAFGYFYFMILELGTVGLAFGWFTGEIFSFISVVYFY